MKIYTDDEIRKMAGHPDCIPPPYVEYFLKGFRACEQKQIESNRCTCEKCTGIKVDSYYKD